MAFWLLFGGPHGTSATGGLHLLAVGYKPYGVKGNLLYSWATPMYGITFGLSILAIGIGAVLFQKRFIPEEISIQDRHDGASSGGPQNLSRHPDRCF